MTLWADPGANVKSQRVTESWRFPMSGVPDRNAVREADALAQRNHVLVTMLLTDKEFMEGAREGYRQCEEGQTLSLEELKQKYAL
jgi:hypothetical protein